MFPEGFSPRHGGSVSGDQLRLLADANIIGVVVSTPDGIVEANDAFLTIIGCAREEFAPPLDWRTLTPPEYAERDQLAIEEIRLRGAYTPFEKEYWRTDGTRVPIQIGGALLSREPMRWISFVQDLSAQKQIERDLRQAAAASEMSSRAKDDFVNMLVHELRQPLATISIAALLIKTGLQHDRLGVKMRRPLEVLDHQVASLTRLIDELLLASRIVRGAMPMRRVELDFAALVRDVAEDEHMRADAAGLDLAIDVPADAVRVLGDPLRLRHVITNVLGNAIKYTPPGGAIQLRLRPGDTGCELRVKDNGIGINAEEIPHVFEPFRRASSEGSGFGIGLAVVRSVIESHQGTVSISSDGPNQGTMVVIALPIPTV